MELNGGPKEFSFQLGGWDQRRLHYTECPVFNWGLNRLNSTTDVRCVSTLSLWKIIFFANATNSAGALIFSRCRIIFQMKCFELRCETPEVRIKDGAKGDPASFLSKSKFYFCKNQDELFRPMIFLPWHFESPKHCWIWGKWDLWRKHHKCITKINQKDKQPASDGAGRWNAPQLAFLYIFDQIKESTTKATSGLMTWMIRRLWVGRSQVTHWGEFCISIGSARLRQGWLGWARGGSRGGGGAARGWGREAGGEVGGGGGAEAAAGLQHRSCNSSPSFSCSLCIQAQPFKAAPIASQPHTNPFAFKTIRIYQLKEEQPPVVVQQLPVDRARIYSPLRFSRIWNIEIDPGHSHCGVYESIYLNCTNSPSVSVFTSCDTLSKMSIIIMG